MANIESITVTCSGCGYSWLLPAHATVSASSMCSVCAESREAASAMLALLDMPAVSIRRVLDAARAQGEVMTDASGERIRVEYRAGIYTVTP